MHIKKHVVITSAAALAASHFYHGFKPIDLPIMLAGGVLVDIDHVWYFMMKMKTVSFKQMKRASDAMFKDSTPGFYIYHTWFFMILSGILFRKGILNGFLYLGYMIHILCDIMVYLQKKKGMIWVKKWSVVYMFWKQTRKWRKPAIEGERYKL
ncbi:MAG TPA: hypothetical protein VF828_02295 [Patescibacteria group bacterium]